jgi:hypothetical protein
MPHKLFRYLAIQSAEKCKICRKARNSLLLFWTVYVPISLKSGGFYLDAEATKFIKPIT